MNEFNPSTIGSGFGAGAGAGVGAGDGAGAGVGAAQATNTKIRQMLPSSSNNFFLFIVASFIPLANHIDDILQCQ
jgi:hypothetical protein